MNPSDEALYESYMKRGEDQALEALFERHKDGLALFLYGFTGNLDDAEELMLDTFAAAISENARFKGDASFKNWLYTIGRNRAVSFLRKKRFRWEPIQEDSAQDPSEPALDLIRDEKKKVLYRAIAKLDPEYRQVLTLVYLDDVTADEAARIMKKSKKQVYNLTFRGKEALKKTLSEMGYSRHD